MKKPVYYCILLGICLSLISLWPQDRAQAGLVFDFNDALSSQTIATGANHTISFTSSAVFGPDNTMEIFFDSGFDLTRIDYTDIDFLAGSINKNLGTAPGHGVSSNIGVAISGQTITFTQNDSDSIVSGSTISILIGTNATNQQLGDKQIYNPETADTYSISLSGSFGDSGTVSIPILTTNAIGFRGDVEQNLSFALRNGDDTDSFSGCDFGVGSYSSVGECSYRLAIDTNLPHGFQVFIQADGNLRYNSDYIANITAGQTVTAGTEGYGLELTPGTDMSRGENFDVNDSPIPSTGTLLLNTNSVYNYIQGDLSTSDLITLKLAVSAQTKAGYYSQSITYSVIANF